MIREAGRATVNAVVEFAQYVVGEVKKDFAAMYKTITEMFASKKDTAPPQIPFYPSLNVEQVGEKLQEPVDLIQVKSERQNNKEVEIDKILTGEDLSTGLLKIGTGFTAEAFRDAIKEVFVYAFAAEENASRDKIPHEDVKAEFGKFKQAFEQFLAKYEDYAKGQDWSANSRTSLKENNETLRVELNKMLKVLDIIREEQSADVRLYALQNLQEKLAKFEGVYTYQTWRAEEN